MKNKPYAWALECPTMTGSTAWILSWSRTGAGMCNRLIGDEHERALYAAPLINPPPIGFWNGKETVYFEHELVEGLLPTGDCTIPLYIDPPTRKPLTDEQIDAAWRSVDYTQPYEGFRIAIARAIERAHGIGE